MAITYSGQLTWIGDTGTPIGNLSITRVRDMNTIVLLRDFALALNAHSLCNLSYRHYIRTDPYIPAPPGVDANVDEKAIIYFRDPDTMQVENFSYPAPIAADLEDVGYGKVIKESVVIAIVTDLNTATAIDFVPLYGKYYVKR